MPAAAPAPLSAASAALRNTWKMDITTAAMPHPPTNAPHGAYTVTGHTQLTLPRASYVLAKAVQPLQSRRN